MMRRWHVGVLMILGIWLLGATVGCEREPTGDAGANQPDPEKSFAEIARMVKEGMEMPGGAAPSPFISSGESGRSQFIVRNIVTSNLVAPSNAGETYRGTITVTSQSTYSLRRPPDNGKGEGDEDDAARNDDGGYRPLDEARGDGGVNVLDDSLISSATNGARKPVDAGDSVSRHANEDVRTIDLAYENGRWVDKTELDPETEQSLEKALERALRLQP